MWMLRNKSSGIVNRCDTEVSTLRIIDEIYLLSYISLVAAFESNLCIIINFFPKIHLHIYVNAFKNVTIFFILKIINKTAVLQFLKSFSNVHFKILMKTNFKTVLSICKYSKFYISHFVWTCYISFSLVQLVAFDEA